MRRVAPAILFAFTFVVAGYLVAAPTNATETETADTQLDAPKASPAKAGPAKAGRAKGPAPGGPEDESALWWNDPKIVKALSLTDEQRDKMGESLKRYRDAVPQDRRPEAFHEYLVQGDWKAARAESEKVAQLAESAVRQRGTLKIDVLEVLSDDQRQLLVDHFPNLIYQPWRRAMSGGPQLE